MNKIITSIKNFAFDKFCCKSEFKFKLNSTFNTNASYTRFISMSNMVFSTEERIFFVKYGFCANVEYSDKVKKEFSREH